MVQWVGAVGVWYCVLKLCVCSTECLNENLYITHKNTFTQKLVCSQQVLYCVEAGCVCSAMLKLWVCGTVW